MPVTINGVGTIGGITPGGLPSGVIFADTIAEASYATISDIAGITIPTGVITSGTAQLALSGTASQGSIGSGFYVTGPGIPPGTTVISGAGTFVLGLSQNCNSVGNTPLAQGKPYTFYKENAIVTPGVIGGQLCRAWVNFNAQTVAGTGSASGIRASYNVSSITDSAVGQFAINFSTAMPDTNYVVVTAAGGGGGSAGGVFSSIHRTQLNAETAPTVGTFTILCDAYNNDANDTTYMSAAVFR